MHRPHACTHAQPCIPCRPAAEQQNSPPPHTHTPDAHPHTGTVRSEVPWSPPDPLANLPLSNNTPFTPPPHPCTHPPGTAKSEVGRRLSRLIQGSYFERLLTRFSVPEELFGPLSMRALEEDKYVRQTRGYLPDAQVSGSVCGGRGLWKGGGAAEWFL